jgi:ABC-type amino acid transport substrate-binding protein
VRMRFGRIVAAGLSLGLLASACAKNSTPAASGTTGTSASTAAFTTVKPGYLTVGSCLDFAPFETVKNGTPIGFDVDMTDAIAAKIGYAGKVRWTKANFNTIFTAVAGGEFDLVAAAVTATGSLGAKRAQTVSFSNYYYDSRQSFSVNSKNSPSMTTTDQLKSGDSVGVQKGTTGAQWAIDNLQKQGITIREYNTATQAFQDLSAGNLTGVINDESSSYAIAASMTDVKVVEPIETNEKYAFAFAPTSTALLAAWNTGLKQVIDDGEYAQIFKKYFPGTPVPKEYTAAGA